MTRDTKIRNEKIRHIALRDGIPRLFQPPQLRMDTSPHRSWVSYPDVKRFFHDKTPAQQQSDIQSPQLDFL
jgi:hypothetical protein